MIYLPLVSARWIHFASVFVLFGSSFFWLYMGSEHSSARQDGLTSSSCDNHPAAHRRPVAAISGVAWLALILINMARDIHSVIDPEDWRLYFFETPFGMVSILRLALFTIGVVIAFLPWHGRWWFSSLVPVSALLLITQAWFGHSAEGGTGLYRANHDRGLRHPYACHGRLGGGLPPLLFALVEQRRFAPNEARDCTLDSLPRFSLMAMIAVTLVVASGIANAGFRVAGSFGKLFDTDYGDVLLRKLAVVSAMLALAYFNRFIVVPRLRAASSKGMRKSPGFATA